MDLYGYRKRKISFGQKLRIVKTIRKSLVTLSITNGGCTLKYHIQGKIGIFRTNLEYKSSV